MIASDENTEDDRPGEKAELPPAEFHLNQPFKPAGDQPHAIEQLTKGIKAGKSAQVLLGATGTGKTFTSLLLAEGLARESGGMRAGGGRISGARVPENRSPAKLAPSRINSRGGRKRP